MIFAAGAWPLVDTAARRIMLRRGISLSGQGARQAFQRAKMATMHDDRLRTQIVELLAGEIAERTRQAEAESC